MTSEIEQKTIELLDAIRSARRSPDWETNMRMFAGNDRRILNRIPLVRQKQAVLLNFSQEIERQLDQYLRVEEQLGN